MRELMLVADVEELAGVGATPFAAHVRECDRCRVVARRIAAGTRRFGTELALEATSATPVTESRSRRARRRWLTGVVGVAAAACVAIILTRQADTWTPSVAPVLELAPNEDSGAPTSFGEPIAEAAVVEPIPDLMLSPPLEQVSVDVPEGRSAVVMKTRNPSMTVVWLH
jgi:hypothetical protein